MAQCLFELMHYFMRRPRHVLERAQIPNNVWDYDFGGDDNVLEVYAGYFRKMLKANEHPCLIHTVRGIDYLLQTE